MVTSDEQQATLSKPTLEQILESIGTFAEKVGKAEKYYSRFTEKQMTVGQFASSFAFTRWPNHNKTFVYSDSLVIGALAYAGLYDSPRLKNEDVHQLKSGINNPTLSYPSIFGAYSGYQTALELGPNNHFENIRSVAKRFPGIMLDMITDSYATSLVREVGDDMADPVYRAIFFSVAGELAQKKFGVSDPVELRSCAIGLDLLEQVLISEGPEGTRTLTPSKFVSMLKEKIMASPKLVTDDDGYHNLSGYEHYSGHYDKVQSHSPIFNGVSWFLNTANEKPWLQQIWPLSNIWDHFRPSTDGYHLMQIDNWPPSITSRELLDYRMRVAEKSETLRPSDLALNIARVIYKGLGLS